MSHDLHVIVMIIIYTFFRQAASDEKFPGKLDELEQGTQFLHENGNENIIT